MTATGNDVRLELQFATTGGSGNGSHQPGGKCQLVLADDVDCAFGRRHSVFESAHTGHLIPGKKFDVILENAQY